MYIKFVRRKEKNVSFKLCENLRIIKDYKQLSCRVFVHIKYLVLPSTQNVVIFPR